MRSIKIYTGYVGVRIAKSRRLWRTGDVDRMEEIATDYRISVGEDLWYV